MMINPRIFIIFILIFILFNSKTSVRAETRDYHFLKESKEDIVAPITTDARYILIGGAAVTTTLLLFKHSFVESTQREFNENHPLKNWSHVGNLIGVMLPNLAYIGFMELEYYSLNYQKARTRSVIMAKATLYSELTTTVLKSIVREKRPDGSDNYSFPSGHSTAAFSFASVVAMEHQWFYGLGAFIMATFTGLSRMNDNRHFLHDVVAGATIGASYGVSMSIKEHQRLNDSNLGFHLLPTKEMDGLFMKLEKTF